MVPNGDGTYGVVAESQAIVAPSAWPAPASPSTSPGPSASAATATGKPGDPRNGVAYTGTPVLTVEPHNIPLLSLSLQDLLGPGGVNLPVPPLLTAAPRRPAGRPRRHRRSRRRR